MTLWIVQKCFARFVHNLPDSWNGLAFEVSRKASAAGAAVYLFQWRIGFLDWSSRSWNSGSSQKTLQKDARTQARMLTLDAESSLFGVNSSTGEL